MKGRTFKLCVLTRWDFNFCVRSSPLRGTEEWRIAAGHLGVKKTEEWTIVTGQLGVKKTEEWRIVTGQSGVEAEEWRIFRDS